MSWTLIAGGAKKLGAKICIGLASSGYDVVIQYRKSKKEAEEVARQCQKLGVQAEIIQGDFSTLETTQVFIKDYQMRFSSTYGFVYNVGNYEPSSFQNTQIEHWMDLFQTNLHAPFILTQSLFASLVQNRGRIVFMGVSGLKQVRKQSLAPAYMATKTALFSFMQSLAYELAPKGVTVNMVSPGHLKETIDPPASFPMRRLGEWSEVERVITFLMQNESCYITGQNIEVAGGVGL